MKHLDENDLARFAEGNIDKIEHEKVLAHLAECDICLKAAADTVKFLEPDRKSYKILKLPILEKIQGYRYLLSKDFLFKERKFVGFVATLIIIVILLPLLLLKKMPDNEINTAKIQYIEESIMRMENSISYGFSKSRNQINAAIRGGFFTEDLNIVLNSANKEKLISKISRRLANELITILNDDKDVLFPDLESRIRSDFKKIVNKLQDILKKRSLIEPYQFGRFVERSILDTFENKLPRQKEIEKFLMIAQKCDLPQGVLVKLEKVKTTSLIIENRKIWEKIKEIF